MQKETIHEIAEVLDAYFLGIYTGDVQQLREVFHPRCLLFGEINSTPYLKTVDEYLAVVKHRKSPHALGEPLRMKIISLDILQNMAYVKAYVPMFEFRYYDYLSLLKGDHGWQIVNKLFTHVDLLKNN
jgi:hypothetical protein